MLIGVLHNDGPSYDAMAHTGKISCCRLAECQVKGNEMLSRDH